MSDPRGTPKRYQCATCRIAPAKILDLSMTLGQHATRLQAYISRWTTGGAHGPTQETEQDTGQPATLFQAYIPRWAAGGVHGPTQETEQDTLTRAQSGSHYVVVSSER